MTTLTPLQQDALAESANISMGSAATALSHLLGHKVQITTPRLSYTTVAQIRESYPLPCVLVRVRYSQGLQGSNVFILSDRDAGVIANMMMGDADLPVPDKLDELYLSAISEAMNQMMGSSATALSEMYGRLIDITPPELEYIDLGNKERSIDGLHDNLDVVEVAFDLTVGTYIASTMIQILPTDFAENMVGELLGNLEGLATPHVAAIAVNAEEADTLGEIGNISMGAAATALSMLLDRRVDITTPRVAVTTLDEVQSHFPHPCIVVNVQYLTGLAGENVLIIRERDAIAIARAMMSDAFGEVEGLDEIGLSAVSEAMNQMMGSSATALSNMFARPVDISPPVTAYKDLRSTAAILAENPRHEPLIQISFRLEVEGLLDSELVQLLPYTFAQKMVRELLGSLDEEPKPPKPVNRSVPKEPEPPSPEPVPLIPKDELVRPFWENSAESNDGGSYGDGYVPLDLIRDIPVRVTGLLGRRTISLKELMKVTAGSVVELNCTADSPVDILANGKLVARGEVVLIQERFGIKITEIVQPWQRN